MSDKPPERQPGDGANGAKLGMWTAIGVGVGAAVFAATDDASWIAWGAAGGLIIGAIVQTVRRPSSRKEDDS